MLLHLLSNLFNAPWPKDFVAEGFVLPDGDNTYMSDTKQLNSMTHKQLVMMAWALITENDHLREDGSPFYTHWIQPLKVYCMQEYQRLTKNERS